ncbi:MAG TPA: alpha/beta hydrolase [Mycobacteriales bacterium]
MPVDPPIQQLLDMMAAQGTGGITAGTPAEARALMATMTTMLNAAFPDGPRVPVGAVSDAEVAGVPVRVYRAGGGSGPVPTTVMFHGGGFVIGDLETHDDQARMITDATGGVVVSVDYRLAPEHPFPAAVDDCEAVTRAVLADIASYGGDPARVGVAGDSAGGNLAAVIALRLRDQPAASPLRAQLLWYPAVDMVDDDAYVSRAENAEGFFLTAEDMAWFGEHYLGDRDRTDPAMSPLRAGSLAGLPAAVVATAEFDPLRDEGEAYAAALDKAGCQVVAHRYDGLIHGFVGMVVLSPAAAEATAETLRDYADLLG